MNSIEQPNGTATPPDMTPQHARLLLEQEKQQRADVCRQELAELLQRHRCTLDVSVVLRPGQVVPQIGIVAQE